MRDDSGQQGVFEPLDETGSAVRSPEAPVPLAPVPPSSRSIVISIVSAVAALVYVFSPIDLVPEALLPLVGFVDDLLVFVGGMVLARAMLVAALSARARYRKELREYEESEQFVGKWSA
jgi:hypothetical protein